MPMNTTFDFSKPVGIGADHAGYEYKTALTKYLEEKGFKIKDYGTYSAGSVDYPDFAHPTSKSVEAGEVACGILVCGSANGVAITANKHSGVRAAICWLPELASLARQHNNANIICIPARFASIEEALQMVDTFLTTTFEGGRHETRVNKIAC
ncbi:MAG: ribose 5-phosphate isomerase [Segetibacter sp.]|nr:ribose 5-phosphate isomerase [Segetibacter sp.]